MSGIGGKTTSKIKIEGEGNAICTEKLRGIPGVSNQTCVTVQLTSVIAYLKKFKRPPYPFSTKD